MLPRSPDTLSNLATDCLRTLRDDYAVITVRARRLAEIEARPPKQNHTGIGAKEELARLRVEHGRDVELARESLAEAICEYRYSARQWGIDVG